MGERRGVALARRVNVGGGREDSKETMFQEIWASRSQRAEMEAGAEGDQGGDFRDGRDFSTFKCQLKGRD